MSVTSIGQAFPNAMIREPKPFADWRIFNKGNVNELLWLRLFRLCVRF